MQTIEDLGVYTFPALFKNTVAKFAQFNALSLVHGTPITYKQLENLSNQAARVLYKNGFTDKKKVAIYSAGMPQWGAMYLAIVNNGGIGVPLLPDFTSVEVEAILRHANVDMMVVSERLYSKIKDLPEDLLKCIIKMEDYSPYKGVATDLEKDPLPPAVEVKEEDTASIIYTSGTTGRSKGVELTHKNLVWTAIQCQTVHRVKKSDRCLSFLPLSHVYEFTIGFVMQILNGSSIYYLEKPPTVSTLLPAFKIVRPTVVLSVPLIMEKIYKNKIVPTFSKDNLMGRLYKKPFFRKLLNRVAGKQLKKTMGGKIKFFGIGGAKTDPLVEQFMKEAKFPYAIGYGLTETSPLLAGSSPKTTIPGTIGPVLEGVEMQILNPNPETGIGEVVVKGPNVMKGYYLDPDLTAEVFTTSEDSCGAGWFKTGDLGILEKKKKLNYLSLKGRSKNMILGSSGENIYPEDIEFVLNQHPMVSESLVVEGEKGSLVAIVKLAENVANAVGGAVKNVTEDFIYKKDEIMAEIQYFVNNRVNRSSKIGSVQTVDEFEKTASQKIKRYKYTLKSATEDSTKKD
ncbi:MAG: AMP-binding protein [Candidatus Treponema excrementipullorum]|nr:AMP-binding protein [Candidatus Treponema excrementipullorum]